MAEWSACGTCSQKAAELNHSRLSLQCIPYDTMTALDQMLRTMIEYYNTNDNSKVSSYIVGRKFYGHFFKCKYLYKQFSIQPFYMLLLVLINHSSSPSSAVNYNYGKNVKCNFCGASEARGQMGITLSVIFLSSCLSVMLL